MEKLKHYRKAQCLTQSELAKLIGKTDEAICQYEKGTRIPNIYVLHKIAKILNCSMEDLIEENSN